jgi:hypothetical protein
LLGVSYRRALALIRAVVVVRFNSRSTVPRTTSGDTRANTHTRIHRAPLLKRRYFKLINWQGNNDRQGTTCVRLHIPLPL